MKRQRIVVALGGNALGSNPKEQRDFIGNTAKNIVDLIEAGNEVIITHGNGPQVGMINLAMTSSAEQGIIPAEMPFPECGAMSQGYIGYQLQNSIMNEMASRKIQKDVVTVITQVVVDGKDKAFHNPSKPIGAFYSESQAKDISARKGYCMREDANRGYRRVVPSPKPVDILEKDVIKQLVSMGDVVISVGGGGVPVVRDGLQYRGVDAVIDKDLASAKVAQLLDADMLLILTAVEQVAINWGKPNQTNLNSLTVREARQFCKEGQFAPGSMLPKVEAAIDFAESGKKAIITSLNKAFPAIYGQAGTVILPA